MKKIQRAYEVLSNYDENNSSMKSISASFGTKWPYKRTISLPSAMIFRQEIKADKEKLCSRHHPAPILKHKNSRFGFGQLSGGSLSNTEIHIPSLSAIEDGNLSNILHKIIDLEESDKETIHLLVFLLMQFLSRPDQRISLVPQTHEEHVGKPFFAPFSVHLAESSKPHVPPVHETTAAIPCGSTRRSGKSFTSSHFPGNKTGTLHQDNQKIYNFLNLIKVHAKAKCEVSRT
ncbi:PREDICTED: uncharacterized protein LOC105366981 [Ceratosolen solmsi marchali]|uniref:Uncharacterized protein LOC105366981 n=1 Tax=Ceratosolen solmsi marchali TaxID=326594 RepID=A0AAJ6YTH3_9HYME|nr:PREDICTED: uncharacterized protein LOC105366981 [Ceratosolen solmsi marchali]